MEIFGVSIFWIVLLGVVLGITRALYIAYKRVYLSPLSHIPGPKLAIATSWYECYYDVWKRGLYYQKVREFHKKYGTLYMVFIFYLDVLMMLGFVGPIIRINPHEVRGTVL
jgi:hypothetical protein